MNLSQDCCFFPKFSTQQWVKEEIGSWKKLHEDHHYHYIINGVYTLILFNFYVHFCILLQHCSIHNKTYIQYLLLYLYICAPHNIFIWFSILGNKHFVGTTHEQHVYKKTLSLSKISSFDRFLLSTNGWSRWSRVPWVMGVWNLGVGAVGQNSVQGWVPGKISPGGKKEHMIQYTILKTHESPLKRGASSKGKDCFTICYFSGDMWMFFGCVFVGV